RQVSSTKATDWGISKLGRAFWKKENSAGFISKAAKPRSWAKKAIARVREMTLNQTLFGF
ncbi:MAG: hypothetical protein ACREH5_00050, partial [Candidatus Omnitrophota bacterium]